MHEYRFFPLDYFNRVMCMEVSCFGVSVYCIYHRICIYKYICMYNVGRVLNMEDFLGTSNCQMYYPAKCLHHMVLTASVTNLQSAQRVQQSGFKMGGENIEVLQTSWILLFRRIVLAG